MAFKVAARTVLELGAELISSDAVAIYELVKNAIDAGSPDGVTIELCITLPHSDYVDALTRADALVAMSKERTVAKSEVRTAITELRESIGERLLSEAPTANRRSMMAALDGTESATEFRDALRRSYRDQNWIEFRDTGHGMSRQDLLDAYLVIGTASRKRAVETAVHSGESNVPFLGEKGVGRLSAMRLGSRLQVRTATRNDRRFNLLDVDWTDFYDLDTLLEDVPIEPAIDGTKPDAAFSGTTIRISDIQANWSARRIQDIAATELGRFSDPFSKSKRRFRIVVVFNGERVDVPRLDRAILDLAHATVMGQYEIVDGRPHLEVNLSCGDLGKGNPPEEKRILLQRVDLRSLTQDAGTEIPASALTTVGPFSLELYWYNRRLLRAVDSIGERKRVQRLQEQWSGIMLFRDGYRVFPYGDEKDDWLGLDRLALGAPGYKLNKLQFIGRVSITRFANPELIDQTNREGLKDCDEKQVLVEILRFIIHDRLRQFLDDVDARHTHVELDFAEAEKRVKTLEGRAHSAIRTLQKRHAADAPQLRELLALFEEMQKYFAAAKQRAEQIEDERDRMIQLAGVGLMLEIVAHELARSTEHTMRVLEGTNTDHLPSDVTALFGTLRDDIKAMNKRLRVLDPLSVSARQRKETFDFPELVREVLEGRRGQFRRHGIEARVHVVPKHAVLVFGVRGMFVQILENLVQNSVYWLDLRKRDEEDFRSRIEVTIDDPPQLMQFYDNGPGVEPSLRDEVFKAFFSTKGKTRRQGLGLYIARDCATHNGGQLYLSDERRPHRNRLNTFVLEIPEAQQ